MEQPLFEDRAGEKFACAIFFARPRRQTCLCCRALQSCRGCSQSGAKRTGRGWTQQWGASAWLQGNSEVLVSFAPVRLSPDTATDMDASSAAPPPAVAAGIVAAADAAPLTKEDTAALGRLVMSDFLRSSRAYDILPESNKVVVFDVAVPVKLAFYALVEHGGLCGTVADVARRAVQRRRTRCRGDSSRGCSAWEQMSVPSEPSCACLFACLFACLSACRHYVRPLVGQQLWGLRRRAD